MKNVNKEENHYILSTVINYPKEFEFFLEVVPYHNKSSEPKIIKNFDELLHFFEEEIESIG